MGVKTSNIVTPGLFSTLPTTGATVPTIPQSGGITPATGATSSTINSAGSFLSSLFSGNNKPLTSNLPPGGIGGYMNSINPTINSGSPQPGLLGNVFMTPIKSQTITTAPDGTTTVKYDSHPPDKGTGTFGGTAALPAQYNYNSGVVTPTGTTQTPPVTAPITPQPITKTGSDSTQTPPVVPTTNQITYPGLVQSASNAYQQAGNINQMIGQNEVAAQENPNYSQDTALGVSGAIARNYGLLGENALTQAQGLAGLAGTAAGLQYGTPATSGLGGAALNPLNNINSIAQQVISGTLSPSQAYAMGGSVQNWQGLLNNAIQTAQPNFDTAKAQANYDAKQSNVQTQGTAVTNAANTGYSGALQEYNNNTASYTALTGISNQVVTTLSNYANTGALTDYNAAVNTLQSHLSNPDYQKFVTAIGNAQAAYQAILGSSGVTPTKADQDAVNALNPNSSASTIVAALNQLSADAHALTVVPSYNKVQNYKTQLGI